MLETCFAAYMGLTPLFCSGSRGRERLTFAIAMARNKKQEIASLRRELAGERLVPLTRLAGDSGTDDGERRHQLVWQNFRIKDCTTANATVLGTEHPDFIEGNEAAAANTVELFETMELYPAGIDGVPLDRLASIHAHYFGSGFEKCVGKKLRAFCTERFEYDDRSRKVRASNKVLTAMRKVEARDLIVEEKEHFKRYKAGLIEARFGAGPSRCALCNGALHAVIFVTRARSQAKSRACVSVV
ncbi:unnamed protein product [Effrenium voratum]|nr:unnamed protein product [Effrenium voratum]CAJ1454940.1 unnamed protein product [Effrenium voratum]